MTPTEELSRLRLENAALAAKVERMKECLNKVWEADEMGYMTDIISRQCVQCGEKAMSTSIIVHNEECVQGWIEAALTEPPSSSLRELLKPVVEALEEIDNACCDENWDADDVREVAQKATAHLRAIQNAHDKPTTLET